MQNYYRIGITNEGNLLLQNSETFHGVVIGGNFAAFYKNWLAAYLRKLKKPFFIDPHTEVFGLDLNNIKKDSDFRASFQKLINHFDNTAKNKFFSNKIKQGKLSPIDFVSSQPKKWNTQLINVLVNGTIALQKNMLDLDTTSNKKSIKKYLKILEELEDEDSPNIEFLVAPYFYSSNTHSPWFEINVKLLEVTVRKAEEKVYAVLCLDRDVLGNKSEVNRIISKYKKAAGFLIWINGFNDIRVDKSILKDYLDFIRDLGKAGKPIISLYGGYYTLLLSKYAKINGYSRGIGLGESKEVESPASGGGSPNRYYIQLTHSYVVEENAIKVLERNPDLRCLCKICKPIANEVIKKSKPKNNLELSLNFFRRLKPQQFKEHFMQVHFSEINHINSEDINPKKELEKDFRIAQKKNLRELDVKMAHLERWYTAL